MSVNDFFCDHIKKNFSYTPTPCQNTLFDTLSSFTMQHDECDIMVVNGYAGTGKTSAIAAYVKTLKEFEIKFKLMAPTGRAAKVLAGYTGYSSLTIHKQIYRQKSSADVMSKFTLDFNKANDTVYIVDEASLISIDSPGSLFGSGNLLMDLVQYVRNGSGNKLILIGDTLIRNHSAGQSNFTGHYSLDDYGAPGAGGLPHFRHGGTCSILFGDGHVKGILPVELTDSRMRSWTYFDYKHIMRGPHGI